MEATKSTVKRGKARRRTALAMAEATALAVILLAQVAGSAGPRAAQAAAKPVTTAQTVGGATFDFYSMFPEQYLSPAGGSLETFMPLDTRNIGVQKGKVTLAVSSESQYFKARVTPPVVEPATGKPGKSRVYVECAKDTPDGTVGWFKVVGSRAGESHHIWLKVDAVASRPRLDLSRGPLMAGDPGYLDAQMQPYTGKPMTWHVAARNEGAVKDTYKLSWRSEQAFDVTFKNIQGRRITEVTVPGKTRNLLYSKPVELVMEVVPKGTMPLNQPQEITFVIGPGKHSGATGSLTVSALNPGELFCINATDGLRPHAHQVLPGESTTFMFHVTNLQKKTRQMGVRLPQTDEVQGWRVQMDGGTVERLRPGQTASFTMKVTAPRTAAPAERHEFTVELTGGSGPAQCTVAAEISGSGNIYYWSIDSMDPEYLYLDREGTAKGSEGDWLMPNVRRFMQDSADYSRARCYMPSATDMNHTNALAGTYTGTMGVYMVGGTFRGFTEHDETLSGPNSVSLMKYGPDGQPVERMYEVAKRETGGKALTGFWSNKNWLADMEGEESVDIVGHSEKWPLFYNPPYKYRMAGDPETDENPSDPASVSVRACFHSNNSSAVMIPTMLGQFDLVGGAKLLSVPLGSMFGKTPGLHAEDRYITGEFLRSVIEEDPDVSYVNIGDLDNTGHFTGSSWDLEEFSKGDGPSPAYDRDAYSPDMRRDDALDMCREADALFGSFIEMLKERGVYQNSTVVFLSDHGMENMKDPKSGYEVIDLRDILRDNGLVRHEDYEEVGGTELNNIWAADPARLATIQKVLEEYTVNDPVLGKVRPLNVVNREEARNGKDFGVHGKVLPGELYSEYWINHPDSAEGGQVWPDLFVFPLYNYQVMAHGDALASGINNVGLSFGINVPESVKFGLPAAHGGLQTTGIPLIFKAPSGAQAAPAAGSKVEGEVEIGDIAPTIYRIMGWTQPACVDGKPLPVE